MTKETHHLGWFQAKHLWPLLQIVHHARETDPIRFIDGSIILEPCRHGGAYIVAVSGHATIVIRDEDAHVDTAVTLDIPDKAFEIAKGPSFPCMIHEGSHYQPPLPEWMMPGRVYVHTAGMFITPKMRHPDWAEEDDFFQPALFSVIASTGAHTIGLDFRMKEGRVINWPRLVSKTAQAPAATASTVFFNPRIPALFSDLMEFVVEEEAARDETSHPCSSHEMKGEDGAHTFMLRFDTHPDILAFWMGMKPLATGMPDMPAHFLDHASEETGK